MKLGSTGYESHPAADLFPMMGEAELAALADDIERNGLHQPIILLDGQVLDGRNRLLACERTTRDPRFERWDGSGSPTSWVLSQNLHRRHLTDTDRKLIAAEAAKLYEEEAKERRGARTDISADLRSGDFGKATEKAARDLGVSTRGVEQAKRVIEKAPVLAEAVRTGKASLDAAAALASEPADVQRELVAAGPQAIREAAKEKRAAKPSQVSPEERDESSAQPEPPPSKLSAEERERLRAMARGEPEPDPLPGIMKAIDQALDILADESSAPSWRIEDATKVLAAARKGGAR